MSQTRILTKIFLLSIRKNIIASKFELMHRKNLTLQKVGPKLIFTMSKVEKPLNITLHKGTILSKLAKKKKNLSFTNQ